MAGLLNIAKCLHDAIHRLEKKARRAEEKESEDGDLAASMIQVTPVPLVPRPTAGFANRTNSGMFLRAHVGTCVAVDRI